MPPTPPASSDVRAWAQSKGLPVGDRGRIRSDVVAAYLAETAGRSGAASRRAAAKGDRTAGKASTASAAPVVPPRPEGPAGPRRPAAAAGRGPGPVAALQEKVEGLERQVGELLEALRTVNDRVDAMTQVQIRRRPSLRSRLSG